MLGQDFAVMLGILRLRKRLYINFPYNNLVRQKIMQFIDAVTSVLQKAGTPLSPAEIRDRLKIDYPHFYGTESHQRMVERRSCQSLDHALMLQVYNLAQNARFTCDRSVKPMQLSIAENDAPACDDKGDFISAEAIEKDAGTVYILKTGTFTRDGKEIIKIGITSGEVEQRISQLYTTGVPYRFSIHAAHKINGFIELERALHSLLARFRLSSSREFFTDDALPFVDKILALHKEIIGA